MEAIFSRPAPSGNLGKPDRYRSPALRHNIQHFCVRELGAITAAYPATRPEGINEQESMLGWLIYSSHDARFPYIDSAKVGSCRALCAVAGLCKLAALPGAIAVCFCRQVVSIAQEKTQTV